MRMEDFQICKGKDGVEFVEFTEGPTKIRQCGLNAKQRSFQSRMFATGTNRYPVLFFKENISRRPVDMQLTGPFYLSIKASPLKPTEKSTNKCGIKSNEWGLTRLTR